MRIRWRSAGLWVGLFLAAAIALVPSGLHDIPGAGHRPAYAAAIAVLMACWWFSESFPIAWTAAVPLVAYPLLGVFTGPMPDRLRQSVSPYLSAYIFLFLGGMVLGAAIEETNLHRRIALRILLAIGTEPRRLILGVLVATAAISMWISNTATAVMMLPIGMALIAQVEAENGGRRLERFGGALMLSIAWGANVGGIGTKIGTGVNSIFAGFLSEALGYELSFLGYLAMGAPFVLLFTPLLWLGLWRDARHDDVRLDRGSAPIRADLLALGPMSRAERRVAAVFALAAALWVLGDVVRPALAPMVPKPLPFLTRHYEAAVALLVGATVLAARLVGRRTLRKVPWGTLVLLGGSFALADGVEASGLSSWLSAKLAVLASWPFLAQLFAATLATVFLSAFASNTATVNVMLHVLPRSLPLLGAANLGASCDFALPAGTPPNAIVFGSGYVRLPTMMRLGLVMDLAASVAITLYAWLWIARVL
jgi:sodium-dependent dicarboxylate transporter 2/3/5